VVTIRLFGQVRFEVDDAVAPLRAPARAVVALGYLASHHDVPVSRDFLAALLWPDDEPEDGRAKLRRNLHVLGQALPAVTSSQPYLLATMRTVRWNPEHPATVDAIAFAEAGRGGRTDEAAAWYTGNFLDGYHDDWILAERERLRNLQLEYLRASLQRKRGERDLTGALNDIARIFDVDPWREDVLRVEMLVRAQLGDRSGALAAYRGFARRLRAELDVEPTPETRAAFDALVTGHEIDEGGGERLPETAIREMASLPFAGREREFATLSRAWASAARGKGHIVLIAGEAGASKSRLAHELALHVESQGGGVLIGTTTPGEARPYEAVLDALRDSLSLVISAHTPVELGILARVLAEIAARTTVVESESFGPEAERARIFEAIYLAIAALARKRPLLVVLEDLHWATASTAALVEYLARRLSALPVLIVATHRDEEVGRAHPLRAVRRSLESEGTLERLALPRFDRATVGELIARVFPGRPDIDALADDIYRYSEGVPLFLDEAVHEGKSGLAGTRLHVSERVESLGESARTLIELAAVIGAGFTIELLGEVAGWDEAEILRILDELVEARFVRQGRRRTFGDYAFSHHLVHAAVYAGIPDDGRRRRHLLVAHASSKLFGAEPDRAGEIAVHYDRGGDAAHAARAYATAARHAIGLYANDEAMAHAQRALALDPDGECAVEMHAIRALVGQVTGRSNLRAAALDALSSLKIPPAHLPTVERLRAVHLTLEGRLDEAWEAGRRYLAAASAIDDRSNIVQAYTQLSTIAVTRDQYDDAEAALAAARAFADDDNPLTAMHIARAQTFLAQRTGAHDEILAAASLSLLREAQRAGDVRTEGEAHNRLAHVAMAEERFDDARAHFDAFADTYRRLGMRGIDGPEVNTANLASWVADYETARRLYAAPLAFAERNEGAGHVACTVGLALVDIYTGEFAAATARLDAAAHRFQATGTLEEANFHFCRALIASETGNRREAKMQYDAALEIHETKRHGLLQAVTLAFAILDAIDAGDSARARFLDNTLASLPERLMSGEEFPHLMLWARSRVAELDGDRRTADDRREAARRIYERRVRAIGTFAPAYARVPWNARFLDDVRRHAGEETVC
jgi:DNA-binding SARP family transcriptional activator/tetratricopeptide (TPR) repeat protein